MLEDLKVIAVIAIEAVLRAKPNKTQIVLNNLTHSCSRKTEGATDAREADIVAVANCDLEGFPFDRNLMNGNRPGSCGITICGRDALQLRRSAARSH